MSPKARLREAAWLDWPELHGVFRIFADAGHEIRVVGGAVRDALLGRDIVDVDLATTAKPEQVMDLVQRGGLKTAPVGLSHGTVMVIAGNRTFEVTTLREDVETYGRHATVAYTDDWVSDARRRDFTINALYASADGQLHDPLGGLKDIEDQRIRFIGDADARIKEDFLRILRFFRFNAEMGQAEFDSGSLQACGRQRAGMASLSADRVRGELFRLLIAPQAIPVIQTMSDHGHLVPILGGVTYAMRYERLAEREALLSSEPSPVLRLGALALGVEEDAVRLSKRLNLSNRDARRLLNAAGFRVLDPDLTEAAAKALLYRVGAEAYRDMCLLTAADRDCDPVPEVFELPQRWPVPEFPLRGRDLVTIGVEKGPHISEILGILEAEWIEDGFRSDRSELLKAAEKLHGAGKES